MNYNVKERLEAVHNFLELDFDRTSELRDIISLAAQLCGIPIALVTLLDENENWLKIRSGVTLRNPELAPSCQYVIPQNHIPARADPQSGKKSQVQTDPRLRFYAGVPLILTNGLEFGTLCLLDVKTENITELQQKTLTIFSRQITVLLELGMSHLLLKMQIEETAMKNSALLRIAHIQSHDIRQPLASIMGLVNLIKEGHSEVNAEWLEMITEATNTLDKRIHEIVRETTGSMELTVVRPARNVNESEDLVLHIDTNGSIKSRDKGIRKPADYHVNEIIDEQSGAFYTIANRRNDRTDDFNDEINEKKPANNEEWLLRKDGSYFLGKDYLGAA